MAVVNLNVSFSIFAKLNLGLCVNLFTLKRFSVWIRVNLDSLSSAFALICDHLNFRRIEIIHTYISCSKVYKTFILDLTKILRYFIPKIPITSQYAR